MKKKKTVRKKGRKKYATGGIIPLQTGGINPGQPVSLGIESPEEALRRNQILMARADQESENTLTSVLDMFGQYALQSGMSMMSSGISGSMGGGGALNGKTYDWGSMEEQPAFTVTKGAYGLNVPEMPPLPGMQNSPVEVEGEEVGKTPQGNLINFKGASHEQGGIPVSLPPGTEMFSKRIKIDGVTMANREKKRHKKSVTLEELLELDHTDALVKNTKQRVSETNEKEQAFDLQIQDTIRTLLEARGEADPQQEKFAYAGPVPENDRTKRRGDALGGMFNNFLESLSNTTAGDALGMVGTFRQGQIPMQTLLESEATNTPNKNAYLNYGADSLRSFDEAKDYAERQKSESLRDIRLSSNNALSSIRNTARGIGSLRAGDLAVHQGTNEATRKVYTDSDKLMMDILSNKARVQESRDAQVMRGEEGRDLADRQDRGAFYSNLAKARLQREDSNISMGKSLNTMKTRGVTAEAMGSLFNAVEIDYKTGEMRSKDGGYVIGNVNDLLAQVKPEEMGIPTKTWEEADTEEKARLLAGAIEKRKSKSE